MSETVLKTMKIAVAALAAVLEHLSSVKKPADEASKK